VIIFEDERLKIRISCTHESHAHTQVSLKVAINFHQADSRELHRQIDILSQPNTAVNSPWEDLSETSSVTSGISDLHLDVEVRGSLLNRLQSAARECRVLQCAAVSCSLISPDSGEPFSVCSCLDTHCAVLQCGARRQLCLESGYPPIAVRMTMVLFGWARSSPAAAQP